MEANTKNRAELKSYFVKNSIPTQENFADLINGMLNLKDDGLVKSVNNPLSIEAGGDATSAKDAIHFYRDFTKPKDWVLSLNLPGTVGPGGTAPTPGFNISDGDGNSRLFIDQATGNVGLGTTAVLSAALTINKGSTNEVALLLTGSGPGWASGIQFQNTAPAGKTFGIYAGQQGKLHFADVNRSVDRLVIDAAGNVGIGTASPIGNLHIGKSEAAAGTVGNIDRLVIQPYGHTGGPWKFNTRDDNQNAYLDLRYGSSSLLSVIHNGNVGIGTNTPNEKLMVKGGRIVQLEEDPYGVGYGKWAAIGTSNIGWAPSDANSYGLKIAWDSDAVVFGLKNYGSNRKDAIIAWGDDPSDNLRFLRPNDVDTMIITGGGNVGIGTTDPGSFNLSIGNTGGDYVLHLASDFGLRGDDRINIVKFGNDGDYQIIHKAQGVFGRNTLAIHCEQNDAVGIYSTNWVPLMEVKGGSGDFWIRGSRFQSSSRTIKNNIASLSTKEAFEILENLEPVTYYLKADETKKRQAGFIAEDVPDLIASDDHTGIIHDHIVAILTQVVKEQQKIIEALQEKIGLNGLSNPI